MSLFLATLADLHAALGIATADTTDDTALTTLLEGLQGRFEDFCGRKFLRTADVLEYPTPGQRYVQLERFPLESVAAFWLDPAGEFSEVTKIPVTELVLNKVRGRILLKYWADWPEGNHVKVQYTGGYVAVGTTASTGQYAVPDGLRRLVIMQAAFEWRNKTTLGTTAVSGQGVNVQGAAADLLPEVKAGLASYCRI